MHKHFTQKQFEQAKQTSLIQYLISKGERFKKEGNRYRHIKHDSLVINQDNKWFWNSRNLYGNNAISYLRLAEKMSLTDAIHILLGKGIEQINKVEHQKAAKEKRPFSLPEKNENYRRAFAYLNKTRGIDSEIISNMMKQKRIYESKKHHNCVFVGYDESGNPQHASMWGTYCDKDGKRFKGEAESSDKSCGFAMTGKSRRVYVFESPIDAMSHATMDKIEGADWRKDYRLSLCCTWDGALERFLKSNSIDEIVLCLDNDEAGNTASEKYKSKYSELGYEVTRDAPIYNDFNEELMEWLKDIKEYEEMEDEV
jgi:hypothetical protein